MNRKIVILISGKRCSGKDTVADCIKESNGYIKKVSFGTIMKMDYCKLKQINMDDLKDRMIKEKHRPYLIEFAESQKQKHGMDYWAKRCWSQYHKNNDILLISDWRFLEEYQFFQQLYHDGYIHELKTIRVEASNESKLKRGWKPNPKVDGHRGEVELDSFADFTYVIYNNGTEDELSEACETVDIY